MQDQSEAANRQVQVGPKTLILAEAEKLLYQNIFNSLNDIQQFIAYFYYNLVSGRRHLSQIILMIFLMATILLRRNLASLLHSNKPKTAIKIYQKLQTTVFHQNN